MEPTNKNENEEDFSIENLAGNSNESDLSQNTSGRPTGMENIFEELTMMAMKKRDSGLDISNLNPNQVDKLLDAMVKNEENMFAYHTKKLDTQKEVKLEEIGASIVGEYTNRYVYIGALLLVGLLTILIMIFQDRYFMSWLTFLTGLAGGFGISKIPTKKNKSSKKHSDGDHED